MQIVAYAYLSIGFARALHIVWDIVRRHHHQEMPVMYIVWPITPGILDLWGCGHTGSRQISTHNQSKLRVSAGL